MTSAAPVVVAGPQFPFPPVLFPFAFVAMWLVVTSMLTLMSRWRTITDRYPARDDPPLRTLGFRSGRLGWVDYRSCLTLKACPGGLRVSAWKLFAPFQRAFEVPWDVIVAEPPSGWIGKRVKLHLGSPELGVLEIGADSWAQLTAAAPPAMRSRFDLTAHQP